MRRSITRDSAGRPPSVNFFARSPFNSILFLVNTFLLVFSIGTVLFALLRFWNQIERRPVLWLILSPAWMLMSWLLALRNHGKLRELHDAEIINEVRPDSSLEVALDVASNSINHLLFYSFLAITLLLLAAVFCIFRQ